MNMQVAGSPVRLIVADAHSLFRFALIELVGLLDATSVVAQAGTAAEAIDAASRVEADVIVLDPDMPGAKELPLLKALNDVPPAILIMSSRGDAPSMNAMLAAGARGYVTKHDGIAVFEAAIRAVASGSRYVTPRMAAAAKVAREISADPAPDLSSRERQVAQLIVDEGYSQVKIAKALGLSPKTVFTHKSNIMRKLGVSNNAHLMRYMLSLPPTQEPRRSPVARAA